MGVRIGAPDLLSLPAGPDTSVACVQFGIFLIKDREVPLAIQRSRGGGEGTIAVTDAEVKQALDELLADEGALSRVLLGGRGEPVEHPRLGHRLAAYRVRPRARVTSFAGCRGPPSVR
jgi:hypothetical protein